MNKFLFSEFKEVSSKEWKQKIQVDLKGADYNDTLIWKNIEGIDVKPFYHQDEFDDGFSPIPGHPKVSNIAQEVFIDDENTANKLLISAVEKGTEALVITSEKVFDPTVVFQDVAFTNCSVYFNFKFLSEQFILNLKEYFIANKANVYYNIDIIGNLARTGNWFVNLKDDHTKINTIVEENKQANILCIDGTLYQNSGANMVQQIAYCLAHANEYLNHFQNIIPTERSDEEYQQLPITFKLAIGTNYFFEIAKIRSLRKLYAILAKEYNVATNCNIITFPTKRNKTIYDYNVNMLRTTTENMSAFLGGANTVCSLAYDSIFHKSNDFGERIARNQLLIMKKESYFNTSNDPAFGSYYIESLTDQLSEKALDLFKNIESNGGFLYQLKEGIIQRKIKQSAQKEQALFDTGDLLLLGTNIHTNPNDKIKNDLELYPFVKTNIRKTLLEPIIEKRLSENTEQERLNKE